MNEEFIRLCFNRHFVKAETFAQAVDNCFDEIMKKLDSEMIANPATSTEDFVGRFEKANTLWHEAAMNFNAMLLDLGSREIVAVDSFKPLLRNRSPRFYFSLLMQGMKPLEDECEIILEMKTKYEAQKGVKNG
jgi:hypothetical protein